MKIRKQLVTFVAVLGLLFAGMALADPTDPNLPDVGGDSYLSAPLIP